jgi:hypothetical protein
VTVKRQDNPFNLCQFQFADGRLCGLPALDSLKGYCRAHATVKSRTIEREDDLSQDLPYLEGKTLSEQGIERALNVVFHAFAAKRITTRRAATFGYLAQLMLLSKRGTKLLPEAAQAMDQFRTLIHNTYSNKPPKPMPHVHNKP